MSAESLNPTEPKPNPINVHAALARMDGDKETFQGLAQMFLDRADGLVETIRLAIEQRDVDSTYQAIHKLDGSLTTFYAVPAMETTNLLRNSCQAANWDDAVNLLERLKGKMAEVCDALRQHL